MGARLAAVIMLATACVAAWSSATRIPIDFQYTAIATEVSFWGRDNYTPTAEKRGVTTAAAGALARHHPNRPDYQALAARAHAWQAYFSFDPAAEKSHRNQAIAYQQRAMLLRPAHAAGWRELSRFALAAKDVALQNRVQKALAGLRKTPD